MTTTAPPTYTRIVVHVRRDRREPFRPASFDTCLMDYFGIHDDFGRIECYIENNIVYLQPPASPPTEKRGSGKWEAVNGNWERNEDKPEEEEEKRKRETEENATENGGDNLTDGAETKGESCRFQHPPFCVGHKLSAEERAALPPEQMNRGVDVGVCILLESSDGRLLVTRRSAHMRTFPGVWVPPGGHMEEGETLAAAGIREMLEETGIELRSLLKAEGDREKERKMGGKNANTKKIQVKGRRGRISEDEIKEEDDWWGMEDSEEEDEDDRDFWEGRGTEHATESKPQQNSDDLEKEERAEGLDYKGNGEEKSNYDHSEQDMEGQNRRESKEKNNYAYPGHDLEHGGDQSEEKINYNHSEQDLEGQSQRKSEAEKRFHILGLWESFYPPVLYRGQPKRHHLVVYLHLKLQLTAADIQPLLKLDNGEVDACVWLTRDLAEVVVYGAPNTNHRPTFSPLTASSMQVPITLVDAQGAHTPGLLDPKALRKKMPEPDREVERISTGTRWALKLWLQDLYAKERRPELTRGSSVRRGQHSKKKTNSWENQVLGGSKGPRGYGQVRSGQVKGQAKGGHGKGVPISGGLFRRGQVRCRPRSRTVSTRS